MQRLEEEVTWKLCLKNSSAAGDAGWLFQPLSE